MTFFCGYFIYGVGVGGCEAENRECACVGEVVVGGGVDCDLHITVCYPSSCAAAVSTPVISYRIYGTSKDSLRRSGGDVAQTAKRSHNRLPHTSKIYLPTSATLYELVNCDSI